MPDRLALIAAEKATLINTIRTPGWAYVLRILDDTVSAIEQEAYNGPFKSDEMAVAGFRKITAAREVRQGFLDRLNAHQFVEANCEFRPVVID
jgi:hypothetical protein